MLLTASGTLPSTTHYLTQNFDWLNLSAIYRGFTYIALSHSPIGDVFHPLRVVCDLHMVASLYVSFGRCGGVNVHNDHLSYVFSSTCS